MTLKTHLASLAVAIGLASMAKAQALATFGSVEAAGLGESSALIGASMSTGNLGWGPVGTLVGQTYRYRSSENDFARAYAVSPSIGVQNTMSTALIQASIGYSFVHTDSPVPIIGVATGSSSGVFVAGQGIYWGTGENTVEAIASYGFADEYYWTRLRAAHRLAPTAHPIYLGAEVVYQGTLQGDTVGPTVLSMYRYQIGPTVEYRISPDFRVGVSGGYRGGNNNAPGSGYARIEFLVLSRVSPR